MSDTDKIQPKILKLKKGNEYKIRIEDATEFKDSFLKDTYVRASKCVSKIIENTRMYHDTNKHSKDNQWDKKDKEEYNNIIVFSGERGTGKSSAFGCEVIKQIERENRSNAVILRAFPNQLGKYWVD